MAIDPAKLPNPLKTSDDGNIDPGSILLWVAQRRQEVPDPDSDDPDELMRATVVGRNSCRVTRGVLNALEAHVREVVKDA